MRDEATEARLEDVRRETWTKAIDIVKDLLPELEETNKIESAHGFIGTSYELGQTKEIIELLERHSNQRGPD